MTIRAIAAAPGAVQQLAGDGAHGRWAAPRGAEAATLTDDPMTKPPATARTARGDERGVAAAVMAAEAAEEAVGGGGVIGTVVPPARGVAAASERTRIDLSLIHI